MTQQKKQILLQDFCARLPYGVICHTEKGDGYLCSINQTIFGTEYGINISPLKRDYFNDSEHEEVVIKPYLRPLSSMTEKEKCEYCDLQDKFLYSSQYPVTDAYELFDWLNEHHFDFCGLISMGLALEAKPEMYKI